MKNIIDKLNEAFLPQNTECDGGACMGCWKDVIRGAIKMLEEHSANTLVSRSAAFDEFIKETESTLGDWIEDFEAQAKRHPYKAKEKLQQAEKHRQILVEFKRHFG